MIKKSQALEILNEGLKTGADFSEIYIENKCVHSFSIENGKVDSTTIARTYGAGIRLLNGYQSVFGYTNEVTKDALLKLVRSLSASYNENQKITVTSLKKKKTALINKPQTHYEDVNDDEIISFLKVGEEAARTYDPKIIRSRAGFNYETTETIIFNSKGFIHKNNKERARCSVSCVACEGEKIETSSEAPGTCAGFEYFKNNVNLKQIGLDVAKRAITMLGAKECPSGKMPVVIGNAFGGVLFHEACGHPLEASSVSKNLSVFAGKIGQQIASSIVSAVDDGTIENEWGSNNIDDEGNKTERTVLIKDGILVNYLIDDFTGRRLDRTGNGACRRQSYKYEPTSRMSNTFICNGKSTPEEIIKATKLGLYAVSLGGGSVNPVTGEFNFGCSEAYMIRDGKICEPVRGASVIGTGQEVLMNIDMVGNDLAMAPGVCGASSGMVPVNVGQPTIRISNITVGGNGGELK